MEKVTTLSVKDVTAYVLCGGYGTRLRQLTNDELPKPLYPINGLPILDHNIQPLLEAGIGEINFIVAHHGKKIMQHFENSASNSGTRITFTDQGEPTGIIPALQMALKTSTDSGNTFLISDGDTIRHGFNALNFLQDHITSNCDSTILTINVDHTERHYGVLLGMNHQVINILKYPQAEKTHSNRIFTGLIACNKRIKDIIFAPGHADISWYGLLIDMIANGTMNEYLASFAYFNLNSPEAIREAEYYYKGQK